MTTEIEFNDNENKSITTANDTSSLIALAINNNVNIEALDALIRLKNNEIDRQAKQEFDFHFTEMQKEFEPIQKTKKGYDYDYAPLPEIIKKYGPIISKHGFSFKWKESKIDNGKRVTIIIRGWGHEDSSTYFDVPQIQGTKRQNTIQVAGTMSSYGERYTFKAGFGIVEIGIDTDGQTYDEGITYGEDIKKIRDCSDIKSLIEVFRDLWTKYGKDPQGQKVISIEKDRKKRELQNENN